MILSPLRIKNQKSQYKPKLCDFQFDVVIGVGNFGKVFKAFNKKEKRLCAIKILQKESVAQMKHVDHIINELEVLQYLQDKNIQEPNDSINEDYKTSDLSKLQIECPYLMGIYGSFQDKDNLYFELEYIQGCTLLSQIRQYNEIIQQRVAYYSAEVILTLSYLHSHNIIYRDLKPENVVISMTEKGHLKLVDFGFSKRLLNINQKTYTNCGTPVYIAPEILRGQCGHGFQADIWSLGVLMVEISSGQTPFQGENTEQIYENIIKCQPVYNKNVSQVLRDLLSRIFVLDPELRISIEEIKEHKLFKDFDWSVSMKDRFYNSTAPYVPQEAMFNEKADRNSEKKPDQKPKNLLAAIFQNTNQKGGQDAPVSDKQLQFDEAHYNKFERDNKKNNQNEENEELKNKRKRQNPLGDFKFIRINELF